MLTKNVYRGEHVRQIQIIQANSDTCHIHLGSSGNLSSPRNNGESAGDNFLAEVKCINLRAAPVERDLITD